MKWASSGIVHDVSASKNVNSKNVQANLASFCVGKFVGSDERWNSLLSVQLMC